MLYQLWLDPKISNEVKAVIEEIFLRMDPRDYNWVWSECECENCVCKKTFKNKIKAMGFEVIDIENND